MRVDKILLTHCQGIDADMKTARQLLNNMNDNYIENKNPDDNEFLMEIENWRNKNVRMDQKMHGNLSTTMSKITHYQKNRILQK